MQRAYFHGARAVLSVDRWHTYATRRNEADVVIAGNYAWNVALSESLYPVMHILEVALRNRVFDAVAAEYPVNACFEINCWLDARPSILLNTERQRVQAAKRALRATLHLKYSNRRAINSYMTPGRLVASLTFGFWTYLFSSAYGGDRTHGGLLWPQLLPAVFPALPKGVRRGEVEQRLNAARQLRNRTFHYEPIWQHPDLSREYDRLHDLCHWLAPEMARTVAAVDHFDAVRRPSVARLLRRRIAALATTHPDRSRLRNPTRRETIPRALQ